MIVDANGPRLILQAIHVGGHEISRPDARLEAVVGVVDEFGDSVEIVVIEGLDADDGPKEISWRTTRMSRLVSTK